MLGIIIPAHDEAAHIGACVSAAKRASEIFSSSLFPASGKNVTQSPQPEKSEKSSMEEEL